MPGPSAGYLFAVSDEVAGQAPFVPPEVEFLTFEDVLEIHADELAHYGGADGIIDEGAIRAAVGAPQHAYHYSGGDITEAAAAYLYSLAAQQGFADGNKRTALHAAIEFLLINGYRLNCPSERLRHDDARREWAHQTRRRGRVDARTHRASYVVL